MSVRDAFATLELDTTASYAEVKSRYKQLALRHHPDKNPNDPHATRRFQQVGEAYNTLSRNFEHKENPSSFQSSPFESFNFAPSFGRRGGAPFEFRGGNSHSHPYEYYNDEFGGHSCPNCEDEWYDYDEEEEDELDFFLFIFEEMMRGGDGPRSYTNSGRRHANESPEAYGDRLRKFGEEQAAATERRAREEAERKERRRLEQEEEALKATQRRKDRAAEKAAARVDSALQAETKIRDAFAQRQRLRSAVFGAARAGNSAGVRKGVYEDSVDASGPETLRKPGVTTTPRASDTLLHIAAKNRDLELIEWLSDHNAEPEERDAKGFSVFHVALAQGSFDIVDYLLKTFSPPTDFVSIYSPPSKSPNHSVIQLAVASGNVECVHAVLDAGLVDLDDIDAVWKWVGKQSEKSSEELARWAKIKDVLLDIVDWNPPPEKSPPSLKKRPSQRASTTSSPAPETNPKQPRKFGQHQPQHHSPRPPFSTSKNRESGGSQTQRSRTVTKPYQDQTNHKVNGDGDDTRPRPPPPSSGAPIPNSAPQAPMKNKPNNKKNKKPTRPTAV